MKSIFYLAILVISLTAGCKEEHKKEDEKKSALAIFQHLVDSIFASRQQKKPVGYVVLPNSGCGGCISAAEQLLVKYASKDQQINFIFTNITSVKNLRLTFGDSVISRPNVFLDESNLFYGRLPEIDRIYPVLFYFDSPSGKMMYEYVNPDHTNAIANFEKYLSIKSAQHLR